jgi:hypothetical protein
MTNLELMNLSIEELRDLNKRLVEVLKDKVESVNYAMKGQLVRTMMCKYVGNSKNVKFDTFEILKVNRTKAECRCLTTNSIWNIQLANLEPTGELAEKSHSIVDKTERQPNNRKQW